VSEAEPAPDAEGPHDAPPAPAPRRRRAALWVTVTAFCVLASGVGVGAGLGWQALAVLSTTEAQEHVVAASTALSDATDRRGAALDKARASASSMATFVEHARPDYLDEATAKALTDAQARLTAASAHLTNVTFDPPRVSELSADLLPWTVLADVQRKEQLARQEAATARTRAADAKRLNAAEKSLETSATAVYTALAAHGEQVLTADTSATFASKLVLRHAIDDGTLGATSSQFGGDGLLRLMSAVDDVNAAQTAGEAAKQDPAYPIRAQIEDYARSIAHGVPLDFEWHKEVSGLGDGWYSGTTQYHDDDGGWATIDLNFTLQDGWSDGDVDARALVTHEVGHAQVVRPECKALFDGPAFRDDDEMWATAWAIAMGFDTGGSGIEAYGRPTDQQIAVAGQCR